MPFNKMAAATRSLKAITNLAFAYAVFVYAAPRIIKEAYNIRMYSIHEFGTVIHEFDPYFNFRATEYLYWNGWERFMTWFDYMSWYPLGRPVGTTIYPGMQVTAVWIKNHIMTDMSLNDVCVYIPVWFGAMATFFTGLLAYECSQPTRSSKETPFTCILEHIPGVSMIYRILFVPVFEFLMDLIIAIFGTDFGLKQQRVSDFSSPALECALFSGALMSIVPAHLMRSVGGGFDNESVAVFAMTLTFYLWIRSLRGDLDGNGREPIVMGFLAGIAYFNMVAAWGGYVFVINLIGVHAAMLILLGRHGSKLYKAYTTFYIVGTFLATRVPVVGLTPIKSVEQLGPCAVFFGLQLLEYVRRQKIKKNLSTAETWKLRIKVGVVAGIIGIAVLAVLMQVGHLSPLTSRVRGLFVKHTKTGNPLVDSVAEHQPANSQAYFQYLSHIVYLAPIGFGMVALRYFTDQSSFLLVYGIMTYFFSLKMVRLVLLTAPIGSILAGIVLGRIVGFTLYNILGFTPSLIDAMKFVEEESQNMDDNNTSGKGTKKAKKATKTKKGKKKESATAQPAEVSESVKLGRSVVIKSVVFIAFYILTQKSIPKAKEFYNLSHDIAKRMSHPTIMTKGQLKDGSTVLVDDYRACYWWLRDNTPKDSRVMAWWDYGYQITAIANRTTLADGNTWNHEHIALLGRALTSPEKEGHRIARHLADYVLVWAGGGGDDLAKSPHLARIANSVYRSMCPGDPTCSKFGYTQNGPTKMMRESLLYKLHGHRMREDANVDDNRFKEVYMSKYGKCRIYKVLSVSKESKDWVKENKDCDANGSWYCRGQYPPALQKILAEKKDFSQLEDFNKKEDDSEYQKQYFEQLQKRTSGNIDNQKLHEDMVKANKKAKAEAEKKGKSSKTVQWKPDREVSKEEQKRIGKSWQNTQVTNMLHGIIQRNEMQYFLHTMKEKPEAAFVRSSDGRGPMWWAHENNREQMVMVLKRLGVSESVKDANGKTPLQVKVDREL